MLENTASAVMKSASAPPIASDAIHMGSRHARNRRRATRANALASSCVRTGSSFTRKYLPPGFPCSARWTSARAVLHVDRRHPRARRPELQHATASHDRLDDARAKPRAVAVHQAGKRGGDGQPCGDVAVELFECGREDAAERRRPRRFVFCHRAGAYRTVAAGIGDIDDTPRRAARQCVEQLGIHPQTHAADGPSAPPGQARLVERTGRKVKHPISHRLVLPGTRLEQRAQHRYRSGATHPLRTFGRLREAGDLTALCSERRDQRRAEAPRSSGHKRGDSDVAWHFWSVRRDQAGAHPHRLHITRTSPVRRSYAQSMSFGERQVGWRSGRAGRQSRSPASGRGRLTTNLLAV